MMSHYKKHIFVCSNQKAPGKICCANTGGEPFFDYMKQQLKKFNVQEPGKIHMTQSGCLGRCKRGPCLVIYPEGVWYSYASYADVDEIIQKHVIDGFVVERLLIK